MDGLITMDIINPLAQTMFNNNYELVPVLKQLFKSEHFFDMAVRGCMIKNTLDCFYSSYNTFEVEPPTDILEEYKLWVAGYWEFQKLEQAIFKIPSVAGWKAYYQAPQFYRDWINSASLTLRQRMLANIRWLTQYVSPDTKGYDFLNSYGMFTN